MHKKFIGSLLFILFISTSLWASTDLHEPRFQIHLSMPEGWALSATPNRGLLEIFQEELKTTVNVLVYTFSEPVTINGFQIKRKVSQYDGWLNLHEREGTAHESQLANVDESFLAIYAKKIINDTLQLSTYVSAEYYYLQDEGKKGYVLSISTKQDQWKKVQESFREIQQSFWVGEGNRPFVKRPYKESENWEMIGKNASNQNYVLSNVNITTTKNTVWTYQFQESLADTPSFSGPVISQNRLYTTKGNKLISLFADDGSLLWEKEANSPIQDSLLIHKETIYYLTSGPKPMFNAISSDGQLRYQLPLKSSLTSAPIWTDGHIIFIDNGNLTVIDDTQGTVTWELEAALDHHFHPVASGNHVIMISQDRTLLKIDIASKNILFDIALAQAPLFAPIIAQNSIIIIEQSSTPNSEAFSLSAFDLNNGSILWNYTHESRLHIEAPPSLSGEAILLIATEPVTYFTGEDLIPEVTPVPKAFSIDLNTGALVWEYTLADGSAIVPLRGIANDNTFYLLSKQRIETPSPNVSLVAIDTQTGVGQSTPLFSIDIGEFTTTIQHFRIYAHGILLQLKKNRSSLSLFH